MMEQRRNAKDLSQERGFHVPRGIAVDDQDRIFVVDSGKGRLQVYQKIAD
jgi:sugar lactone lactonase YvrE